MGVDSATMPFVGMVMAELAQVGLMIISKIVLSSGMSSLIFVCYSNALASLVLLLIILFVYRSGDRRPPLNISHFGWFFLLGFVGFGCQISGYTGIYFSSATLGTAMLNLVPGFTFVLAITFRMELLDWRSFIFAAKSVGTVVSISGALIVTLYQGPAILTTSFPMGLHNNKDLLSTQEANWIIGGSLLSVDCVLTSCWVILQAFILKRCPAPLIVVFHYCFFVAIQSGLVALVMERDLTAWSLTPTSRLMAVLYSGVFGSAFQVVVSSWCLQRTGPVFVCMFKPLGIAIAVGFGVIFSGDTFYLGSLIGIILIVMGFYSVMWGKVMEKKNHTEAGEFSSLISTDQDAPLLGSCAVRKK